MTKALSKKEIKTRNAEVNRKVNKKRDFRKFANKFFKNPTEHLPLKMSGLGSGKSAYCYDCKMISSKVVIADSIITCKICGGHNVELRSRNSSLLEKLYWRYKEFIYARCNKK